ncbi:hypothetical protein [Mesorhizobium tianshanense]|uniref:hypothetical protein n=1 Tax=Mesorhizobium tianshanense TaxID=39844 RepID=UPI00119E8B8D|nr:hypothetical protein [Mesorhizobium tianshanense]
MTFLGIKFPSRPAFRWKVAVMRPRRHAPNPARRYGNIIDETETGCRKSFGFHLEHSIEEVDGLPQAALAITAEKRLISTAQEGSDGKRSVNA